MPRNYKIERDAVVRRWYGGNPHAERRSQRRGGGPIAATDCYGIPTPVNAPFLLVGDCLVWANNLNDGGYGTLLGIDGKQERAHRIVFAQTRGQTPEGLQINHLCDRPYCVQPTHLYAGTQQDNSDDARIFKSQELYYTAQMVWWPAQESDNPLLRNLRGANRYGFMEAWEPAVQPPQIPLEEFTCPGHDFAIPLHGDGEYQICRICEVTERQEAESGGEWGLYSLIADLCPATQTVTPLFTKVAASDFAGESCREMRRKAYFRSGAGMGDHELRKCPCRYCAQDRRDFRAAIAPLLSEAEKVILEACDRLEPRIAAALEAAAAAMMGKLAEAWGMADGEAKLLKEHIGQCSNGEYERRSTTLERHMAFLLHALIEFTSPATYRPRSLRWLPRSSLPGLSRDDRRPAGTSSGCKAADRCSPAAILFLRVC